MSAGQSNVCCGSAARAKRAKRNRKVKGAPSPRDETGSMNYRPSLL